MQKEILTMFQRFVESHKQMLESIDMKHNTIVINAFAGPGAGKTTSAWEIATALKKLGYTVELAPEYAKELIWADQADFLNGSEENQLEVLQEQTRRLDILYGKVDFIIADSPLILNSAYLTEYDADYEALNMELYEQYHNFSYFVERDKEPASFETEGRIHNYDESVAMDNQLRDMLRRLNIYVGIYNHATVSKIVSNIIKHATGKGITTKSNIAEVVPQTKKEPTEFQRLNALAKETALTSYSSIEDLERLLTVIGRFNYYSSNNILLLTAQFPSATLLRTYDDWQSDGYKIGKGQRHIGIIKREDQSNGKAKYLIQQLFDISQTDADSAAFTPFKPSDQLIIKSLISMMGKGKVVVDGSKSMGECALFSPDEKVIFVEKSLPAHVLINALVREMVLYDIAGHTKYDRQKSIGIATASSYAFCSRYRIDTEFLDLDDCMDGNEKPNEKDVRAKIDSIRGHVKDLSIRVDRFINKIQKKEEIRE